jgi:hypothetical protein
MTSKNGAPETCGALADGVRLMVVALFGFRSPQTIPCLFHRLGIIFDFAEAALNVAQLFKHGLDLGDNTIDLAHSTTSFFVVLGNISFSSLERKSELSAGLTNKTLSK